MCKFIADSDILSCLFDDSGRNFHYLEDINWMYIYLGPTIDNGGMKILNGSIWGNPNTYDGIFSCDCKDDLCDEDNCYCSFKKYTLLFPSILDLFIVTYYYRYNSVCRWNG